MTRLGGEVGLGRTVRSTPRLVMMVAVHEPYVREVQRGGQEWVVRAEPRGVPIERSLLHRNILNRARRLLSRDKAWVIRARLRTNDPFGPDVRSETVATRDEVAAALEALADSLGR